MYKLVLNLGLTENVKKFLMRFKIFGKEIMESSSK